MAKYKKILSCEIFNNDTTLKILCVNYQCTGIYVYVYIVYLIFVFEFIFVFVFEMSVGIISLLEFTSDKRNGNLKLYLAT